MGKAHVSACAGWEGEHGQGARLGVRGAGRVSMTLQRQGPALLVTHPPPARKRERASLEGILVMRSDCEVCGRRAFWPMGRCRAST